MCLIILLIAIIMIYICVFNGILDMKLCNDAAIEVGLVCSIEMENFMNTQL